ncbi:hypothetical protein G7Z17_g8638 [Cylindrodendrum hubeiense]|uniref:Uncharacterized protein n=1 Tax=Cylindrodendrum hubeiense TaxID=595255 RepID=A0A9P5H9A0_9HYPO|nr:hypothetical protein G7Z17_g8638 [Cylindrodendrum hubeiense]
MRRMRLKLPGRALTPDLPHPVLACAGQLIVDNGCEPVESERGNEALLHNQVARLINALRLALLSPSSQNAPDSAQQPWPMMMYSSGQLAPAEPPSSIQLRLWLAGGDIFWYFRRPSFPFRALISSHTWRSEFEARAKRQPRPSQQLAWTP